jgi:diguanylate cyclase (GGDEF)-like protein/PAS domain S-box-containing protein
LTQNEPDYFKEQAMKSIDPTAKTSAPLLEPVVSTATNGVLVIDPIAVAEHFKAIVQSSDDAIISKTLDGTVMSWNPGATAIFGYMEEEMIGQSMLKLFPLHLHMEEALLLERIVDGQYVSHFETVRKHKDGHPINVSVTISPIRNQKNQIIGASKIARDITNRKAIEDRLNLISNVFTHTSEAVVITDTHGRFLEVNDAFINVTGYSREEVIGRDFSLFHSSRQGPDIYTTLLTELRATGHCQGEVWSRRKLGESFAGLLTINTVYDDNGIPAKYIAIFADITPLRKHQERLEKLVNFDALTGLPNRLLLSDRLKQAMAHAKRNKKTLAVAYLDLDGFKEVNDRYGHDTGDDLLIAIAQRIQTSIRDSDTLARMGGDEFVVVLTDVSSPHEYRPLLERILDDCNMPIQLKGQDIHVSGSLGVTFYPEDNSDVDQLMRHADQAMYEAKQAGKNRFQMFDLSRDAEIKSRSEVISRITQALVHDEFQLYFQPKVNMRTGALVGVEALIRWNHPERGVLSPAAFLPQIENHPLIETVGDWVIEAALAQMVSWQRAGLVMQVSINIAARQFQAEHFATNLASRLARHLDIAPSRLELELLETSALANLEDVVQTMMACRRQGFHIAVDDFGTGYSSLTYLRRLPAETLKIDQSFVRDMLDDNEDLAIVKGVIGLANAFNRQVIAEGVETIAHGEKLLSLGCELAQGYGIARPMPGHELAAWIASWQPPAEWRAAP